ncbi:phospholipase D-like domain-containing protein [Pontibacter fetidus]|nr:phospholipase D-like domain-containing protein [Pontibacter fetidus]
MLEQVWVRDREPGDGTNYIISGFSNYNGGVRFYEIFKQHIDNGGQCIAILGGSTSQRLSSIQVVEQLLEVGCKVYLINRKRILHAKCYGFSTNNEQGVVISSGNFTGPGMSQNIEASMLVKGSHVQELNFSWNDLINNMLSQNWSIYEPTLADRTHPAWQLLYDEIGTSVRLEDAQEVTMLLTLSHADTARIQAAPGTTAGKGTQYFWLSKDSYDFFPALTIRNERGHKATYSALINMNYVDLGIVDNECRVTFEAENNLDFRLGTGKLRYSRIARSGDLAAITRISEFDYELRVLPIGSNAYTELLPYAVNFIGHQGKRYGYISNEDFSNILTNS